jgi:hypothetical protein
MILTGVLVLFAVGIFRLSDFTNEGAKDAKVVSEKEALKLYIDQTATAAAEKAIARSEEKWEVRWAALKEDMQDLKRVSRWGTLRSDFSGPVETRQ